MLFIGIVKAQEPTDTTFRKNAINLSAGLETGYFKDLNFSPLNYKSTGVAINFGYSRSFKNGSRFFLLTNPQVGAISTEASEAHKADHYTADIGIGYLVQLPMNASKLKAHVGGQYHTYLDLVFFNGVDAVTFFGLHSFDLLGEVSYELSDQHTLKTSLSLPVLGLLVRPPYTGWDKYIVEHAANPLPVFYRGNWTSYNDYLAFTWKLHYAFELGPKLDLVASYQFNYHHTKQLKTATLVSNQLTIGTQFKF